MINLEKNKEFAEPRIYSRGKPIYLSNNPSVAFNILSTYLIILQKETWEKYHLRVKSDEIINSLLEENVSRKHTPQELLIFKVRDVAGESEPFDSKQATGDFQNLDKGIKFLIKYRENFQQNSQSEWPVVR